MSVSELLLWEKYRPTKIEDCILLPRISKRFQDGVKSNYVFYGNYGTGKTSLARILIGKYSKKSAYLELNNSFYTSIDVLREEIDNFCKSNSMFSYDDGMKYVLLDEFEKTSSSFQEAFKGFFEKYNKYVRFIMTTNNINKINGGILSRTTKVNFNCTSIEEEKYLKTEIYKKIKSDILPKENKDLPKEEIANIIKSNFPDVRNIIETLSDTILFGEDSTINLSIDLKTKLDTYDLIFRDDVSYDEIYHFLFNKIGEDNMLNLVDILGRDFINWCIKNNKDATKLFECNYIISDYASKINETKIDPIILGMTILGKYRDIFKK